MLKEYFALGEQPMFIKSRTYTSAYISVCWGGSFTTLFCLVLKYIEHIDLSFLLIITFFFFHLCYVLFFLIFHFRS